MKIQHVVNVSGGKDSDAVYLLAMESGRPFRACFADTGNEHPWTYEHVRKLSGRTGGPEVEWVKADLSGAFELRRDNIRKKWPLPHKGYPDGISRECIDRALAIMHPTGNQFLDLCLLRGGFPSPLRKFCTDHLKIKPMFSKIIDPIYGAGMIPCQWLGIRRDESHGRRDARRHEHVRQGDVDYWLFRPILAWTVENVLTIHRKHDLPLNPLYAHGAERVGCWPCMNSSKAEIANIAALDPEAIDRLEEWEEIVGQAAKMTGAATFFKSRNIKPENAAYDQNKYGIRAQVRWAKTTRGGKQYPLFPQDYQSEVNKLWERQSCLSAGYCE